MDPIDHRLLDEFQRDFPLVSQPFIVIAEALGITEAQVLARLAALQAAGRVARVGATVRPNTVGASTLAALAVPQDRIAEVAALVGAEVGVNHSYLREDDWNLWFVATAPCTQALGESLQRIAQKTGLRVLDLPLMRAFNIDLGFRLGGTRVPLGPDAGADPTVLRDGDRPLLQVLAQGLPLVSRPFAHVLDWPEAAVLARVRALAAARVLTRVGVIVRHRAIGWSANAMVVWDVPEAGIEAAGRALAAHPGVTLCYQRRTVPGLWPYALFSMIHGQSRAQALSVLHQAQTLPTLSGLRHKPLFSTHCFKQTGALLHPEAA